MKVGLKSIAAAVALGSGLLIGQASAAVLVNFAFEDGSGNPSASGSFSYPNALEGTSINYADLLSYSITFAGTGRSYDLAFLQSGSFDATFYDMDFDSATNTFTPLSDGFFDWYMAAIKASFDSGFFLGVGPGSGVATYDAPFTFEPLAITYTVTKSNVNGVPVPPTFLLVGGGVLLLGALRRRAA